MKRLIGLVVGAAIALGPLSALAGGYLTNGLPVAGGAQYPSTLPPTGNETIPADTNLPSGANPQSEALTLQMFAAYNAAQLVNGNSVVAGDAGQNLWQRGTSGVSTTLSAVGWKSADMWGQWSLATSGVKIAKDSTAADIPNDYRYAYGLTHTNATAGQICMGQSIESANVYQYQGQTVELDFHASTGAGYTGGTSLTAYIAYGNGTDEGLSLAAFTMNGGGATGYTGGQAISATVPISAVSSTGRFTVIAKLPTSIKEASVGFCYTAGTTSTNDYVAFTGIQLVLAPQLTPFVNAATAYETDKTTNTASFSPTSFGRRPFTLESLYQYRWAYYINEALGASAGTFQTPAGIATATTTCAISIPFPVPMAAVPAFDGAVIGNLSATTFKIAGGNHADQALSTPYGGALQTPTVGPFTYGSVVFTTGATLTQYYPCVLDSTASGTGIFGWNANF